MDDFHENLPMKGKSPMMVSMMVPQKSWMGWMGGWMVHGKSDVFMLKLAGWLIVENPKRKWRIFVEKPTFLSGNPIYS